MINHSLLLIEQSMIESLIQKIIDNNRIAIFCASHELSAVVLFQALLKNYHKKVDIILCNTDVQKMDYVLENVDFILFLTYGGRWMKRSYQLIYRILNSSIENCVVCLDDKDIRNYQFDLSPEIQENHFEFFIFLFSVISDAIVIYYME